MENHLEIEKEGIEGFRKTLSLFGNSSGARRPTMAYGGPFIGGLEKRESFSLLERESAKKKRKKKLKKKALNSRLQATSFWCGQGPHVDS